MLLEWLKSEKGENFRLILDVSVALLLFFWLLKNHKIILVYEHTIKDFHEALLKFKNFVKYIKLEGRHKMYIFNPPTKYLKDYKEILKGKYSQISPEYKTKILDYNNFDITSAMGHILFQSKERKEKLEKDLGVELDDSAELFSILDMKLETFDSEYYGF